MNRRLPFNDLRLTHVYRRPWPHWDSPSVWTGQNLYGAWVEVGTPGMTEAEAKAALMAIRQKQYREGQRSLRRVAR
jgi:hypothetical protein